MTLVGAEGQKQQELRKQGVRKDSEHSGQD